MKKTLSLLLALLMLAMIALPAAAEPDDVNGYLNGEDSLAEISSLKISTDGKSKQLTLTWSWVPRTLGFEVWRSTTGKTGSYKRIAEVYESTYTDTGLKNATTYYYAVRGFAWNGEKTIYSPYAKANLSTRITKSDYLKRFRKTYKVMDKIWSTLDAANYLENEEISATYYPVTFKGYTTKAQLKKYLYSYFTKKTAARIVNANFKEIGGKLYAVAYMVMDPQNGLQSSRYLLLNDTAVKKIRYADQKVTCSTTLQYLIIVRPGPFGDDYESYTEKLTLAYERGRWVFGEADLWYGWIFQYAV